MPILREPNLDRLFKISYYENTDYISALKFQEETFNQQRLRRGIILSDLM
jgi:hypothetical protein